MQGDSVGKTLTVAGLLCVFCSIIVSSSVVLLRPIQEDNKIVDVKKNLLVSAGLITSTATRDEILSEYKKVETKIINLETGEFDSTIDVAKYDQRLAAADPKMNFVIPSDKDIAGIKKREKFSKIYLIKKDGVVDQLVLPVKGKGLWSTLYGFLCLKPDANTVTGFGFYEHGETPGLGGEVDNPRWKSLWIGKKIFGSDLSTPEISIVKGGISSSDPEKNHKIDALSGATLTSRGVEHLIHYWMGDNGFGPFLSKFRKGAM